MLPSGYKYANVCSCSTIHYIDTGIYPSSSMVIDMLVMATYGYAFGARNTNSNTSQGQINLFLENNATNYFGYNNQRLALGVSTYSAPTLTHVHVENSKIEIIINNEHIINLSGNTTAFTGTRTMYIGTMNNAGSTVSSSGCDVVGFKTYEGGVLTHDFIPCYSEADNKVGMYDLVAEEYKRLQSYSSAPFHFYLISVNVNGDGVAYAELPQGDKVSEYYAQDIGPLVKNRLVAISNPQNAFISWTDSNGNIVSTNPVYEFDPTQNETFTANFAKLTDLKTWHGFKAMAIKYGVPASQSNRRDDFYCDVISASVNNDAMQRSTTSITVRSVPNAYQPLMPIVILNPKGKVIYCGIIQSIENNVITCREALSIFDEDFLFHKNTNISGIDYTKWSILGTISSLTTRAIKRYNDDSDISGINPLQQRKYYPIVVQRNPFIPVDEDKVFNACTPLISEATVSNFEDYVLNMFDDFGVYVRTSLQFGKRTNMDAYESHYFSVVPRYIKEFETLDMSDNVENISNVVITTQETETTVLIVYNSAGTSLRQFVGITKDGSYMTYDQSTPDTDLQKLIGYDNYKTKIIASDDNINTIRMQNLSNAMFNHKITFALAIDDKMFDFDSIQIGQPVDFYYKDKLYKSVVTGITFDINANDDAITELKITLGKVRTSLSSKLNLGKVK